MEIVKVIVSLAGALGIFLFGMKTLSDGLQKTAGGKLEEVLKAMTGNRFLGILTGIGITSIIQSSSAATVMVVGFASAGMLSLESSIAVIMGANIGTTITAWIVSILGFSMSISLIAMAFAGISLPLAFSKKDKFNNIGIIFLGLALVFIGLEFLKNAIPDISGNVDALKFLEHLNNANAKSVLICVLIGLIVTVLLQSSSAAMVVTITLAYNGWIGVFSACALCLGQNIGTTITAFIASIGGNINARRAAMSHILFNVIGSLIALVCFVPLLHFVNLLTRVNIFTTTEVAKELPLFLSCFHTVFNVFSTILFAPFIQHIAVLIKRIVPAKDDELDMPYSFDFVFKKTFIETPEIYLLVVNQEIAKMSALTVDMLGEFKEIVAHPTEDKSELIKRMKKQENRADEMQEKLTQLCVCLIQEYPGASKIKSLTGYIRICDEFESITDSCYSLSVAARGRWEANIQFDEESQNELVNYIELVEKYLSFIDFGINNNTLSKQDLLVAYNYENEINVKRNEIRSFVEKRMVATNEIVDESKIKINFVLFDMARHLEHIGDFCTNIAQSIAKINS